MKKKRVLFTTHHLVNYAGSELVIFDLAKEFRNFFYDVTVVTFSYDYPIKKIFEKENIRVTNILFDELKIKNYDIIWVQHAPVLYYILFEKGVKAKHILSSSLSPYEPLETPPIFANELSLCLAISEENKKELIALGVKEEKISIFLNSVPDKYFNFFNENKIAKLNNVVVVSNHIPKEIYEVIDMLKKHNIKVDIFGFNNNFDLVTAEKLQKYDAIITIGRTVQNGLSMGIPVYCYDHFGGPGWINKENINLAEFYNFSGRCTNRKIQAKSIFKEITSEFLNAFKDRDYLYTIAKQRYSLTINVSSVLSILKNTKYLTMKNVYKYLYMKKHNQYYVRELKNSLYLKNLIEKVIFQVFWPSDEGYSEEKSKYLAIKADGEVNNLEILLPSGVEGPLRIDPANCPAYIEIQSIDLLTDDSDSEDLVSLAHCSADNDFSGLSVGRGGVYLNSKKSFSLLAIDEDPQLYWDNLVINDNLKPLKLRLAIRIDKERLPGFIALLETDIKNREEQLNQQKNEFSRMQIELRDKEEQITQQANELSQMQDELVTRDRLLSQQANELSQMQAELVTRDRLFSQQANELSQVQAELAIKEEQLIQIFNSRSWRITAPLRWIEQFTRRDK